MIKKRKVDSPHGSSKQLKFDEDAAATKIQALWRGYWERPEVYCCAGARAEAVCNMRGMTPAILCNCREDNFEFNPQGYDPTCPAFKPEDVDATKIQALYRGYLYRRRVKQCVNGLFQAKASAFLRCHRDHGMFPELREEYYDFLWQCFREAILSM